MAELTELETYPRLCALIGRAPSRLSQAMHNAAFRARDLPFIYTAIHTEETEFALNAMRRLGFRGFSLTIPHKEVAVSLVDELSSEVKDIGALNTVINDGKKLAGFNTDWFGVKEALREAGADPNSQSALVFGAGGASRAAIYALRAMGYRRISITNRTDKRAEELATDFAVEFLPYQEMPSFNPGSVDVLINTSPIGTPADLSGGTFPFPLEGFQPGQIIFDMVTRKTNLLTAAEAQGAAVISGLRMLLYQALRQFELFTDSPDAPREVMERALLEEFSRS